eukprot:2162007-Pyramimonas_sp.AAC.1
MAPIDPLGSGILGHFSKGTIHETFAPGLFIKPMNKTLCQCDRCVCVCVCVCVYSFAVAVGGSIRAGVSNRLFALPSGT